MSEAAWGVYRRDGRVLARARGPKDVIELEGNFYFHPDCVDRDALQLTDRTYTCPYKGVCLWVDLKGDPVSIPDCAWVYPRPKPGFRRITGWYGFYPEHPHYEIRRDP